MGAKSMAFLTPRDRDPAKAESDCDVDNFQYKQNETSLY
jgi:hypothetical protein